MQIITWSVNEPELSRVHGYMFAWAAGKKARQAGTWARQLTCQEGKLTENIVRHTIDFAEALQVRKPTL